MARDFANERWVRMYTSWTKGFRLLGWRGRCVWQALYLRADPLGGIDLEGIEPWEAGMLKCELPEEVAKPGMERCLETGWIVHDGDRLTFPRYNEAQGASATGAQRVREHRERELARREQTKRNVTQLCNDPLPTTATDRYGQTQNVTAGNGTLRVVTERDSAPEPSDEPRRMAYAANWLSKATGQAAYPPTKRWRDGLLQLYALLQKSPEDNDRAAKVLASEAARDLDVALMLNPEHVANHWHWYRVGKAPGRRAPAASAAPAPTELEALQRRWSDLEKQQRACQYFETAKRDRIQKQLDELSARIASVKGASHDRA